MLKLDKNQNFLKGKGRFHKNRPAKQEHNKPISNIIILPKLQQILPRHPNEINRF